MRSVRVKFSECANWVVSCGATVLRFPAVTTPFNRPYGEHSNTTTSWNANGRRWHVSRRHASNIPVLRRRRENLKRSDLRRVGTAAAGGYAAGRFLQPAVSFGKEMSRVRALTRIDKNSPQFKALREQAIKLGSETQFTAGDAASGQAFLAMAGFTPQAIQAALPGVLDLAMAAGMDRDRLPISVRISSHSLVCPLTRWIAWVTRWPPPSHEPIRISVHWVKP